MENADADGQFLVGLQLVQQSHNRRVEELLREVDHWKRQTQQYKQQYELAEQQSKDAILKANQQISDLRRMLTEKQQECNNMLEARNQALAQVSQLKAQAGQLQQFKRAISAMVTDGDSNLNVNFPMLNEAFGGLSMASSFPIESPQARVDYSAPSAVGTTYRVGTTTTAATAATSTAIAGAPLNGNGRVSSPHNMQRFSAPRDAEPSRSDEPLDAAAYYQQVKEILEPQAFREFAANIKRLNAGQQSVAETLRNVREIFGEQRPFLFSQLQKLIHQAEEEARRQVEHESVSHR